MAGRAELDADAAGHTAQPLLHAFRAADHAIANARVQADAARDPDEEIGLRLEDEEFLIENHLAVAR